MFLLWKVGDTKSKCVGSIKVTRVENMRIMSLGTTATKLIMGVIQIIPNLYCRCRGSVF